jgi:AcrR family transcriptional regulator
MNMFIFDAASVKLFSTASTARGSPVPSHLSRARKGRRELNKEDKLRRIKHAARKLFTTNGYDEASTRQIAGEAGVALGTLFLYAANKRDLLFLVVNDELEDVAIRAAAAVRADASLLENLLSGFRPVYALFGREPRLSRLILREMMFYEVGHQAKRFLQTRDRMMTLCSDAVRLAQDRKEIGSKDDPRKIGAVIFAIFQVEIRRWLTLRRVSLERGLTQLQQSLEIMTTGLDPTAGAFEIRDRSEQTPAG